jgi:hypothetical protein
MSDYLGHLVERSFAPLPAVRPNTPSRFESSPTKSPVDNAVDADRPVDSKITASRERPAELAKTSATRIPNATREANYDAHGQFTEHPRTGAQEKNSPEPLPSFSPFAAVPPLPQNSSQTPSRAEAPPRSATPLPRAVQPVDPATAFAPRVDADSRFSPDIRPNITSTKGTLHLDVSRSASTVTRKENGPSPSRETSAPPSTIRVSIGRVEIKATPPPSTPSRTTPRKNPALSLENYLHRRSNGGRDE